MKKILSGLVCLVVALVLTTSCSDNGKMKALLEQIPENAEFVAVGNVKTIMESAGGSIEDSKLQLPGNIKDALSGSSVEDLEKANDFLKKAGVDLNACAVFGNYKDFSPVIVFALDDKSKFVEAIEKEKFKEIDFDGEGKLYRKTVYESDNADWNDYGYIAVKDDYAYWINNVGAGRATKVTKQLADVIEEAGKGNFADTNCGDYILDGNAGGVAFTWPKEIRRQLRDNGMPSDVVDIYSGGICLRGNLENDKATVDIQLFDEKGDKVDGSKFKAFMNASATISKDALALLGKDEFMVYAMTLKDFNWDKYIEMFAKSSGISRSDRAQLNAVTSYLEKIDGTVTMGFGLTNGLESVGSLAYKANDMFSQFSTTLVVETKEGKAKQLVEDMKGLMEKMHLPFSETASGFSIDLQAYAGSPGKIYVKNVGNFIAIANHDIKESNDNPLVKSSDLDDYLSVFCMGLTSDNKLMRDLYIKNNVKLTFGCKSGSLETNMVLEIDGDKDTGIIAKAAKIVLAIINHADDIEQKVKSMNPNPYPSWEADSDTVVAYEDYYDADSLATDEY